MIKVLLIDDDSSILKNVGEILSLYGYMVTLAADGKEGVERALKERPDIILCDISMPVLDGFGVLKILRRHPDAFEIPFIFFTAHSDPCDLRKGMTLGADDYLIKPINHLDLITAIETRIKKSKGLKRHVEPDRIDINNLLEDSGAEDFRLVSNKRDIHVYKKKHLLFSAEEKALFIYFVLDGVLKEFWINEEGKEFITDIYRSGDFVGLAPIIEDRRYIENVEVLEDARLMLIPREDFLEVLKSDKVVSNEFIVYLSRTLSLKKEKMVAIAYSSLRKKVAKGLIDMREKLCNPPFEDCGISISREDLACFIGVASESMIRTLKEFKEEGLITVVNGQISIIKEAKLKNLRF